MKKILMALCLVIVAMFGETTNTMAENTTVILDNDGKLNVDEIKCSAFDEMAPGDTRTEMIEVRNDSDDTQNFYVSQNTISTLEECNSTQGAAYKFDLRTGKNEKNAYTLLSKEAGGYDNTGNARRSGLSEIKEIEDYTFFATIRPHDSTNLYMTLYLNGEGNDINYANAVAKLQLSFRTDTYVPTELSRSDTDRNIVDIIKTHPIYRYVKTGDTNNVWAYVVIAATGTGIIGFVMNRRIRNKKKTKNIVSAVCILCTCAMLLPAERVMASPTVSVTFRAGDAGKINVSTANTLVKDSELVDVTKNYIRISVPKDHSLTLGGMLYAAFGITDPDVIFASVTDHEGYALLTADKWGFDAEKKINNNEEYVLDYGVLVDPVMYTIRYVDVDSYDSHKGKYTRQISAPYINYGNAGDNIEMNAPIVDGYASVENKCSFKLERGRDNGHTFFYAYTGKSDSSYDNIKNRTYETEYRYLTKDQIITINTASADNSGVDTVSDTGYLEDNQRNGVNSSGSAFQSISNEEDQGENASDDNKDADISTETTHTTEIRGSDTPKMDSPDNKDSDNESVSNVTFIVLGIFGGVAAILIITVITMSKFGKKR